MGLIQVRHGTESFTGSQLFIIAQVPALHYMYYDRDAGRLYAAHADDLTKLFISDDYGRTWRQAFQLTGGWQFRGIFKMSNGNHLIWVGPTNYVGILDANFSTFSLKTDTYRIPPFNPNLSVAEHNGVVMFAEYSIQPEYRRIWRSTDFGNTWSVAYDGGSIIRHWHSLQVDPYTGDWWAASGDTDAETILIKSSDGGVTWTTVATGTAVRAIGLVFLRDEIIWAIDRPEGSSVYKSARTPFSPTLVGTIEGMSYGNVRTMDGNALICGYVLSSLNSEYAVLYLTNGTVIRELMRVPLVPNATEGGFRTPSLVDRQNRVFIATNNLPLTSHRYALLGLRLPYGLVTLS